MTARIASTLRSVYVLMVALAAGMLLFAAPAGATSSRGVHASFLADQAGADLQSTDFSYDPDTGALRLSASFYSPLPSGPGATGVTWTLFEPDGSGDACQWTRKTTVAVTGDGTQAVDGTYVRVTHSEELSRSYNTSFPIVSADRRTITVSIDAGTMAKLDHRDYTCGAVEAIFDAGDGSKTGDNKEPLVFDGYASATSLAKDEQPVALPEPVAPPLPQVAPPLLPAPAPAAPVSAVAPLSVGATSSTKNGTTTFGVQRSSPSITAVTVRIDYDDAEPGDKPLISYTLPFRKNFLTAVYPWPLDQCSGGLYRATVTVPGGDPAATAAFARFRIPEGCSSRWSAGSFHVLKGDRLLFLLEDRYDYVAGKVRVCVKGPGLSRPRCATERGRRAYFASPKNLRARVGAYSVTWTVDGVDVLTKKFKATRPCTSCSRADDSSSGETERGDPTAAINRPQAPGSELYPGAPCSRFNNAYYNERGYECVPTAPDPYQPGVHFGGVLQHL